MTVKHHIVCAEITDLPNINMLYKDVCAAQNEGYCTCWNIEIYPREKDLKKHIKQQELYLFRPAIFLQMQH